MSRRRPSTSAASRLSGNGCVPGHRPWTLALQSLLSQRADLTPDEDSTSHAAGSTWFTGFETILKLEGKLLEPWIEEFDAVCTRVEIQSGHVGLDLADLTYADAAGIQLLRDLVQRGISISACSGFVAELLREQKTQP